MLLRSKFGVLESAVVFAGLLNSWRVTAAPVLTWSVARSAHFEVYSQGDEESARRGLAQFELLRLFFQRSGLLGLHVEQSHAPVRAIAFRSSEEYNAYRLRSTADAFYIGTESRDYLVLPSLRPEQFNLAAHEYVHSVLHASGLHLPLWLNEGLAEFFSTIHCAGDSCQLGGELPSHLATLRHHGPPAIEKLLATSPAAFAKQTRTELAEFYAGSWALASFLLSAEPYRSHFGDLLKLISDGAPASAALVHANGKPLFAIQAELNEWVYHHNFVPLTLSLPAATTTAYNPVSLLSETQAGGLIADLVLASGDLERARSLYRELVLKHPEDPDNYAALGTIALRRGDHVEAQAEWKQALSLGIDDPFFCYRYANLAAENSAPSEEVRAALRRAILLKPDFDDARYQLALLENNIGEWQAALDQLHAMHAPPPERAFHYWSALAIALTELGDRDEAVRAAQTALHEARDDGERVRARQLAYIASTDLTVQFETDASGQQHLITTRVPHGTTDFNPFIEPRDRIQRLEGTLQTVECSAGRLTGFVINARDARLSLTVPDPTRVLMRNAPSEFSCGLQPQPPRRVLVEFAAGPNILRGMAFR